MAARELRASFDATIVTDQVELIWLLDEDDSTQSWYEGPAIVGPAYGDPCQPLNAAASNSTSNILGFIGDDSRFETIGWDARVLQALRTPGFCWGADGHDAPWPSTVFVSRIIPQTLGWFVPPTVKRGYFDAVWTVLADGTQTARPMADVMFRHDNSKGDPSKPNFDPAFQVPPAVIAEDERAFNNWTNGQAQRDIQSLRRVLYS